MSSLTAIAPAPDHGGAHLDRRPTLRVIDGGPAATRRAWRSWFAPVLAVVVLAAVLALVARPFLATADPVAPAVVGTATVAPGDTLWEVAVSHAPDGTDPRAYLARLIEINHLDSAAVPAWTVVLLPAS